MAFNRRKFQGEEVVVIYLGDFQETGSYSELLEVTSSGSMIMYNSCSRELPHVFQKQPSPHESINQSDVRIE